ncbi:hypothetical protein OEZ85_000783 [Tetradesmus obliquus]|uniref:Uncharacterized protein n=1 Tax=Tetradesmus obliquus TaxID=3088 RepID=A0ABY8UJQ6_TETOB|nr:hypothetical protein OEZ85_000783 [Tetradesmus obliquus]
MGVPERLGGQVWQRAQPDDFDEYTGYRLLYQVEKFSASWRNLVTFYLAMFIAGYAQVVERFLFWGAVAALLLVYWEPYLSPPFPWISGNSSSSSAAEDDLSPHTVQKWGNRPRWLPPPSTREKQAVRQWLYCVRQGYPQRQQLLHRLLQCVIVLPCASMGCGVLHQRLRRPDLDIKSTYSGLVLFVVVLVYTLLTVGSNLAFLFAVRRKLAPAAVAEDWQPQDMMFFTCKILGQFLNTIVQTLVAGAFVTYMPPTIFWLSVAVTAMSYTATNLLYDMGPGAPVQNEEVDSHWVLPCIAILAMLTFGKYQQRPDVYLQEKPEGDKACVEMCAMRYVQLLYALVCLGIISGYYAFTIAVPGCGPVTFVYRCLHHGCFKRAGKPTL